MGLMAIEVTTQIVKLVTVVSALGSAAIAAFGALAKSAANAINAVGEAARNARMSVDSYSALRIALTALGISGEDADAAITALSKNMARFGIRFGPDSTVAAHMTSEVRAARRPGGVQYRPREAVADRSKRPWRRAWPQAAAAASLGRRLFPADGGRHPRSRHRLQQARRRKRNQVHRRVVASFDNHQPAEEQDRRAIYRAVRARHQIVTDLSCKTRRLSCNGRPILPRRPVRCWSISRAPLPASIRTSRTRISWRSATRFSASARLLA